MESISTLKLSKSVELLSLGCPILDACMGGGIPVGSVTEFAGEAAAGKTQLALQLCLTVQLPKEKGGLEGGVAYISTEGAFASGRLAEMAHEFEEKHGAPYENGVRKKLSDNVFVMSISDVEDLDNAIATDLSLIVERENLRLVVIDSIAAVFRGDFGNSRDDLAERSSWLWKLSGRLKRLASSLNIAVVIMNQATALVPNDPPCNMSALQSNPPKKEKNDIENKKCKENVTNFDTDKENASGPIRLLGAQFSLVAPGSQCTKAACGPSWTACVTTRIMLHRLPQRQISSNGKKQSEAEAALDNGRLRLFWIFMSPSQPHRVCRYLINKSGFCGVDLLGDMTELPSGAALAQPNQYRKRFIL
eukprot:g1829.t1